jgi:hypothetical protein
VLPVKKLNILAAVFILALLVLTVAFTYFVGLAKANPMYGVKGLYGEFSMESPQNRTYDGGTIFLNFTVKTNDKHYPYFYFLDGAGWLASVKVEQINIIGAATVSDDVSSSGIPFQPYTEYTIWGQAALPIMSDGEHNLTIGMCAELRGQVLGDGAFFETTVNFSVDATFPAVSILSPENKTYNATEIALKFTMSEPASWMGYSLDGQENITISGNTTLTGLTDEPHNITVYAKDAAGNIGASETVTFTVDTPEPFPTTQVATVVSGASVAVIGVGLFVYFRKRNH